MTTPAEAVPVAVAVPMGGVVKEREQSHDLVSLPVGLAYEALGFQVEGSPPRITTISKESPLYKQLQVGQYCHGIYFPDVQVVNLSAAAHLIELIQVNTSNQRRLLVSINQFYYDECMAEQNTPITVSKQQSAQSNSIGPLYRILLPTVSADALGIQISGFPPTVQSVDSSKSPLFGKIHPHQTVQALIVPGQELFHLRSGAFTGQRLVDRLNETSSIPGRQLVVKDTRNEVYKGESTWWDIGGPPSTSKGKWTIRRMLGIQQKNNKKSSKQHHKFL